MGYVKRLLREGKLRVSISGIRGIVGTSFTDTLVGEFASAFARLVRCGKVLVAQDTRPSGRHFRRIVIRRLREMGSPVLDIGICPTPTVLMSVRSLRTRGAVIVTASHNPSGWNGLKFVGSDGQFLDQKQMDKLVRLRLQKKFPKSRRKGTLTRNPSAVSDHLKQILRHLDVATIRRRRFRIAIDPCNGTGAVATERFLKSLGCRVFVINGRPDGRFTHPPEPTPAHLEQLSRLVKRKKADIGFAQDPDADRLGIVTDKGEPLSGEYTLALAIQRILSQRKTPIVVNLSTSRMVGDLAGRFGRKVYYTKIGEHHVVQKIKKINAAIGGEGNGGVIYPKINPARDSFVGIGLILELLSHIHRPVSALVQALPRYVMIQRKLSLSQDGAGILLKRLAKRLPGGRITRLDGVRIDLKEGWIHARPSNTEPILRLIAEAPTKREAERLLRRALP